MKKSTRKEENMKKRKLPFTVFLDEKDHELLEALAAKEARPKAQMARVLIERALRAEKN